MTNDDYETNRSRLRIGNAKQPLCFSHSQGLKESPSNHSPHMTAFTGTQHQRWKAEAYVGELALGGSQSNPNRFIARMIGDGLEKRLLQSTPLMKEFTSKSFYLGGCR